MKYYLCVLDFEATCWNDNSEKYKNQMEIIEFPSVLYEIDEEKKTFLFVSEFSSYVKPTINPILTEFCTELTGITQEQVSQAETIDVVYNNHTKWLNEHVLPNSKFIFATCGNWDLNIQLPREIKNKSLKPNNYYNTFINVKNEFEYFYKTKTFGMSGMLKFLNIKLEGRLHSGIDDTRNIAKIMLRMINDGHTYDNFEFISVLKKKNNFHYKKV